MEVSKHGTACAEVVFDMASGITMDLHKITTPEELGNAVTRAIADGVDIISMSAGWLLGGPGDGAGPLADIVNEARSNGIFFAVAAGNHAEASWSGIFSDTDGDDFHEWVPGGQEVNYFGPGNGRIFNLQVGIPVLVALHWNDWTVVDQDYNLLLVHWDGSAWQVVDQSTNVQDGGAGQTPEEGISIITQNEGYYGLVVVKYSATRDVCLRILTWPGYGLDERVPERSSTFPADSPDAIAVGAVDVSSYDLEPYSSQGPTFGPGGDCDGGAVKPDLTAYANVSTMSYGAQHFNGTSAATPHVAAAAALLKGNYSSYTVEDLQDDLEAGAIDQDDAGKDNLYGWGHLYLGDPPVQYTVTFQAGIGGSITGSLVQVILDGDDCTPVTAVADPNYKFTGWSGDYNGTDNPLTITDVTSDMHITANFLGSPPVQYTVTFHAGTGGSITGSLEQVVLDSGDCKAVTAVPDQGYEFKGWSDDYTGTENPLTIQGVTSDMNVTANFASVSNGDDSGEGDGERSGGGGGGGGGCFISDISPRNS
jgi:uncharacterized repeat protein (TIGR02543 family)